MIPVQEALARILAEVHPLGAQTVALAEAAGRLLARPAVAAHASPPFDTSAMDGFAVRAADLASASSAEPARIPLQDETIAGDPRQNVLEPGRAFRINTGAPLPRGADAVVRVEDSTLSQGKVAFERAPEPGAHIRRAGEDYANGTELLAAGRVLDPTALGVLASLGIARPIVSRRPRVAFLATGNELIRPGEPLRPGQIYHSTGAALAPLFARFGAEACDLGTVGDDPEETRRRLAEGFDFDVLITTGGVSMGTHDFVRPSLKDLGAREVFWRVQLRPGSPLFVAVKDRTLCFGLPGNPVSVFVTTLLFVRAALLKMQGAQDIDLPWRPALAGSAFSKSPNLATYFRANLSSPSNATGLPVVVPSPAQGSHQFSAVAACSGLACAPENVAQLNPGDPIDFLEFARLV